LGVSISVRREGLHTKRSYF